MREERREQPLDRARFRRQTGDSGDVEVCGLGAEQKISIDEAVRAYTAGSAYAEFAEKVKGTITPGKLADIVILDRDIYAVDPADIDKASVVLTIMDGRVVFEAK